MKRVVDPRMVAHLWANQSQDEARNSGDTFYFRGDTIYSYGSHFPIARHVRNKKGERAVLVTTKSYSITTSRHQSHVQMACHHMRRLWVHNPAAEPELSLKDLDLDFKEAMVKAAEARKGRSTEKRLGEAGAILRRRNELAEFLGRKAKPMPADIPAAAKAELGRRQRAQRAEHKKRMAQRITRLEAAELSIGFGFHLWPEAWQAGKIHSRHLQYDYAAYAEAASERAGKYLSNKWPCMLRVSPKNPEELETSWGAEVPLDHAHRIYKVWARVQGKVPPEGWEPKSQREGAVGSFKVDRIAADGTIVAGCHTIAAAEVRRFGASLGWEG